MHDTIVKVKPFVLESMEATAYKVIALDYDDDFIVSVFMELNKDRKIVVPVKNNEDELVSSETERSSVKGVLYYVEVSNHMDDYEVHWYNEVSL